MCGLIGWVSHRGWPLVHLKQATDAIRHRGPDDEGFLAWSGSPKTSPELWSGSDTPLTLQAKYPGLPAEQKAAVALGHRRLSIVDLSDAGHQPMGGRDGQCWIVYNGEVYNHVELREELEHLGHRFVSNSDTEVILAAWQEWGESCLRRFNGMFAFLLLDLRCEVLFAARDRFGIKPLYTWVAPDGTLAFASEIKQFTVLPGWRAVMNPQRVYDLLNWRLFDHTVETCFARVHQILPGHSLLLSLPEVLSGAKKMVPGRPVPAKQWYALTPKDSEESLENSAQWLRETFTDAVRLRLRADVPVGSCLSGGLDSSAIVCVAHDLLKQSDSPKQRTYSACSHDPRFDERCWAELVADHTQVEATYLYPESAGFFETLPDLVWHHDEPFDSHGIYAYWRMMEQVREDRMKVILNGQGADEQLGGYAPFLGVRLAGLLRRGQWGAFVQEVRKFAKSQNRSQVELAMRAVDGLLPESLRQWLRRQSGNMSTRPDWFDWRRLGAEPQDTFWQMGARQGDVRNLSLKQLSGTNLQMLLHYEDRLSMAHSVEVRVPFLDYRVVEGITGFPEEQKLSDGEMKRVLREAMREVLPEVVRTRPDKQGFSTPIETWMRHESPAAFRAALTEAIVETPELFGAETERIVEGILSGSRSFSLVPWRLLNFAAWRKRFDVALP